VVPRKLEIESDILEEEEDIKDRESFPILRLRIKRKSYKESDGPVS
jgi:hypothetical protein